MSAQIDEDSPIPAGIDVEQLLKAADALGAVKDLVDTAECSTWRSLRCQRLMIEMVQAAEWTLGHWSRCFEHVRQQLTQMEARRAFAHIDHTRWPPVGGACQRIAIEIFSRACIGAGEIEFQEKVLRELTKQFVKPMRFQKFVNRTIAKQTVQFVETVSALLAEELTINGLDSLVCRLQWDMGKVNTNRFAWFDEICSTGAKQRRVSRLCSAKPLMEVEEELYI